MIDVQALRSGYAENQVLHSIDLQVASGEMVGILGPNGSGKSTLLLTLSGVIKPSAGHMSLKGEDIQSIPPRELAKLMAVVPQKLEALSGLKVHELVMMGRYPYTGFASGITEEDEKSVVNGLKACGVYDLWDRGLDQLSGGELQRVYIARALAQESDILLLDEAASGLDIGRKIEIYDLLRSLNKSGKTILTVVHDLNTAALYCDRLVFLRDGRKVLDGCVEDVFTCENLENIYETRVQILKHPVADVPQVVLLPDHTAAFRK